MANETVASLAEKNAELENRITELENKIAGIIDGTIKPGSKAPAPTPVEPAPAQHELLRELKESRRADKKQTSTDMANAIKAALK